MRKTGRDRDLLRGSEDVAGGHSSILERGWCCWVSLGVSLAKANQTLQTLFALNFAWCPAPAKSVSLSLPDSPPLLFPALYCTILDFTIPTLLDRSGVRARRVQ